MLEIFAIEDLEPESRAAATIAHHNSEAMSRASETHGNGRQQSRARGSQQSPMTPSRSFNSAPTSNEAYGRVTFVNR